MSEEKQRYEVRDYSFNVLGAWSVFDTQSGNYLFKSVRKEDCVNLAQDLNNQPKKKFDADPYNRKISELVKYLIDCEGLLADTHFKTAPFIKELIKVINRANEQLPEEYRHGYKDVENG